MAGKPLYTGLGDYVIIFDSNPCPQFIPVQSRLYRNDVARLNRVVPIRVEPRRFMWEKPDAVAEMVRETPSVVSFKHGLHIFEQLFAGSSGLHGIFYVPMNLNAFFRGRTLSLGRLVAHAKGAAQVMKFRSQGC